MSEEAITNEDVLREQIAQLTKKLNMYENAVGEFLGGEWADQCEHTHELLDLFLKHTDSAGRFLPPVPQMQKDIDQLKRALRESDEQLQEAKKCLSRVAKDALGVLLP